MRLPEGLLGGGARKRAVPPNHHSFEVTIKIQDQCSTPDDLMLRNHVDKFSEIFGLRLKWSSQYKRIIIKCLFSEKWRFKISGSFLAMVMGEHGAG